MTSNFNNVMEKQLSHFQLHTLVWLIAGHCLFSFTYRHFINLHLHRVK